MKFYIFFLYIFCLLSTNSFAEIYSYTDKNGITHFTDNMANIPEEYRKKFKTSAEIKSQKYETENTKKFDKKVKVENQKNQEIQEKDNDSEKKVEKINKKKKNTLTYNEKIKLEAWKMAKRFTLDYLKNPGSAKFPENSYNIKEARSYEWEITSYVDAHNDYGAFKRVYFKIKLSKEYNGGTWYLEDFKSWD
ncbi:MAG: DUF4124 domain-containing protein [Desulforegulaceae bacterium]|nr:DUF4124 domain-containing protein [Desulforegulaceae bacterium]